MTAIAIASRIERLAAELRADPPDAAAVADLRRGSHPRDPRIAALFELLGRFLAARRAER